MATMNVSLPDPMKNWVESVNPRNAGAADVSFTADHSDGHGAAPKTRSLI